MTGRQEDMQYIQHAEEGGCLAECGETKRTARSQVSTCHIQLKNGYGQ